MVEFKTSLEILKDFIQPVPKIEQPNKSQISFEALIGNLVDQFKSNHSDLASQIGEKIDQPDPIWEFGIISVRLLEAIDKSPVNDPPALLSITQERDVSMLCELITSFALHYNIEEGVGIPIDRLSKFGVNLRLKRESIDPLTRNTRLSLVLGVLWEIKNAKRKPDLDLINRYFYRKSLHSIVCSLVQIVHSPNSLSGNKDDFKKWLEEDIFEENDGANIVSSIMMAQGL